jgi:hypothetical protein
VSRDGDEHERPENRMEPEYDYGAKPEIDADREVTQCVRSAREQA